jgi:hypothetical protein
MTDKQEEDKLIKRIDLFERYHNDPDQHHKIFTELGFSYMVDECDFNCADCKEKLTCEVFAEFEDDKEDND